MNVNFAANPPCPINPLASTDAGEAGIVVVRLCCAVLAAGVLGWERESKDKPAGLRTNMLVALGSALLTLVGLQLADSTGNQSVDPSRVMQGIVGGIGFLGAGTIIQARHSVHGLTTASTIWLSAAVGIASGMGYYVMTFATVVIGLVVLLALPKLERVAFRNTEDQPDAAGEKPRKPD